MDAKAEADELREQANALRTRIGLTRQAAEATEEIRHPKERETLASCPAFWSDEGRAPLQRPDKRPGLPSLVLIYGFCRTALTPMLLQHGALCPEG